MSRPARSSGAGERGEDSRKLEASFQRSVTIGIHGACEVALTAKLSDVRRQARLSGKEAPEE